MEKEKRDLATNIVSENMNNLLNKYVEIGENTINDDKLQEKIEVLAEIKHQVYLGNEPIIEKVIEKRNKGIL